MIKLDEQTIIDQAWDLDYVKPLPPQRLTDQTVAVVALALQALPPHSSSPAPATPSSSTRRTMPSVV